MTTYLYDTVETQYSDTPFGKIAWRELGPQGGLPLVLLNRFRGTLDHWDPAFLEVLAKERHVIVLDNAGVGFSTGTPADNVRGMAEVVTEFLNVRGLDRIDLLGWSMGGFVALDIALDHPGRLHALVVAGSGPGGVPNNPGPDPRVPEHAGREKSIDEDFLFLFYPDTEVGRSAGLASLRRIDRRLGESHQDASPEALQAHFRAVGAWSSGKDSAWSRLSELAVPVLFANGTHDVMEHSYQSYAMSTVVPNSKTILYGDAGHGFLFQHADDFGFEVLRFFSQVG